MKILVDGLIYEMQQVGGIRSYFNEILPRIAAVRDVDVRLFTRHRPQSALPSAPGIRYRQLVPSPSGLPVGLDRLRRSLVGRVGYRVWPGVLRNRGSTVFHSTYFSQCPWASVPSVVTVYDMIHERFPHLFSHPAEERLKEQKLQAIASATRIIAISETTRDDVCERFGVPPERVDVVHMGCRVAPACEPGQARQPHGRRPFALYVGTRAPYKNFDGLLQALGGPLKGVELDLVAAGPPLTSAEHESIAARDLAGRVRVVEYPTDECLDDLYRQAALFVYPSLYEGFGLPPLEAMAHGCPVAAAAAGAIPEVVGDAAVLFDPRDHADIGASVSRLLSPDVAAEYRRRGLDNIRRFSWDRSAEETLRVYERAARM